MCTQIFPASKDAFIYFSNFIRINAPNNYFSRAVNHLNCDFVGVQNYNVIYFQRGNYSKEIFCKKFPGRSFKNDFNYDFEMNGQTYLIFLEWAIIFFSELLPKGRSKKSLRSLKLNFDFSAMILANVHCVMEI